MNSTGAAIVPLVIVAIAFEIFCLVDLYRAEQVRYFPKWFWVIICFFSIPFGGIVYLIVGREQ